MDEYNNLLFSKNVKSLNCRFLLQIMSLNSSTKIKSSNYIPESIHTFITTLYFRIHCHCRKASE
jgi:hypothetical protein